MIFTSLTALYDQKIISFKSDFKYVEMIVGTNISNYSSVYRISI